MTEKQRTVLIKTREHLTKGWIQAAEARDKAGRACDWTSSSAVSFCLLGAIYRENGRLDTSYPALLGFPLSWDLTRWNDEKGRTQAEVLARIDKALA